MPRGRPKNIVPSKEWSIRVPQDIAARVEMELYSAIDHGVPYGKKSELITELLRQWLKTQTPKENT